MTITEQIRILCIRLNISVSELARRNGQSPQSFMARVRRGSFTVDELEAIAKNVGCTFERYFTLPNGDKV